MRLPFPVAPQGGWFAEPQVSAWLAVPLTLIIAAPVAELFLPPDIHLAHLLAVAPAFTAAIAGTRLTAAAGSLAVVALIGIGAEHGTLTTESLLVELGSLIALVEDELELVDRDIDALMKRTKNRPLVTGAMSPSAALIFALTLEAAAFVELALAVNLLSAVLAVSATLFYVFVYTLWLKRRSTQNIVIGGAAGAVPVLVGWAAVTDSLAWAPVVLFAIIFIWTPPHFWSLAVRYKEDYRAADVPMLPVVASMKRTTTEMVYYTVALVAVTFVFGPIAHLGWIYMITAAVLGAGFLYLVTRLWGLAQTDRATGREAMRVFGYSITYLTVLFVAMAGDVLIRNHIH